MSRWDDEIRRRLRDARLEPAKEAEIAQELAQHLDDRYEELRAQGRSDADAARAALDELREDRRMRQELEQTVKRAPAFDIAHDIRYALRMLRASPAFTLVAVLTLALGIGGTVAIFSAVYAVLYRPLPLEDGAAVVVPVSVNLESQILRGSIPFADYVDWREARDVFEGVALFNPIQVDISAGEAPERVEAVQVSEEYFGVLKVRPLAGRVFVAADHEPKAPRVAIISESLWHRRFGGDPAIVGKPLRLAGTVGTIAGVIPAERAWPSRLDVWLPMRPAAMSADVRERRDNMIFQAVARVRDGIAFTQARARVAAIGERVARDFPVERKGWTSDLVPLRDYVVEPETRLGMFVLLGGVVLVLAIACVNLANLLLARGADRAREMAVRAALGASRGRLVRQMMTESVVLATVGGAAGLLLARWLVQALRAAASRELPLAETLALDRPAALVALAITLGTAVLFGLLPAIAAAAHRPVEALREGGRSASAGRRTGRLRDALVVAQIGLAIVLLSGAGLMLRSVVHLTRVDPGVDVERVLTGRVSLPGARYTTDAMCVQYFERLSDALMATPGVESAAATSFVPVGGGGFGLGRSFLTDGQPEPPATEDFNGQWNVVTPKYFDTVGIRVVRGRDFDRTDTDGSRPVMIINETMARRVFGNTDPIGRRMRSWRDENVLREIVGIVSDVRYNGLASGDTSLVYVPHAQNAWGVMIVAVRTATDPAGFADALRRESRKIDPDVAVARIETLQSFAAASIAPQRFGATLLALFAAAALLLAGIGVYGVMSYVVAQRRHDLGVRLALGASPRDLFALVLVRGLALAGIGTVLGLGASLALAPVMRSLLSGVTPTDTLTLTGVALLITAVAVLACALPGLRASRIDPQEALRQ